MVSTNNSIATPKLRFRCKLMSHIDVIHPGKPHVTQCCELFTSFSENFEAWVDYGGERVRMFWFVWSLTKPKPADLNQVATEIIRQPTTHVIRGFGSTKDLTPFKDSQRYVVGHAFILKGGFLSPYVMLPISGVADATIESEAEDAIGSNRAIVATDSRGNRYFLSIADAKTPDEKAEVESDLVWAAMKYC
jgi:hypothetical protein